MSNLARDNRRWQILGLPCPKDKRYDCAYVDGLSADTLTQLIEEGFADTAEYQNLSPSIGEFIEFLRKNPSFKAFGYVITWQRPDMRVSVTGVKANKCTKAELKRFSDEFRRADEFSVTPPRAWYD